MNFCRRIRFHEKMPGFTLVLDVYLILFCLIVFCSSCRCTYNWEDALRNREPEDLQLHGTWRRGSIAEQRLCVPVEAGMQTHGLDDGDSHGSIHTRRLRHPILQKREPKQGHLPFRRCTAARRLRRWRCIREVVWSQSKCVLHGLFQLHSENGPNWGIDRPKRPNSQELSRC